ncbi:putative MFS-type transporter YfcJ [Austwickia sp. TVS 96-490-7B]|uniref:MFS transporter n=1 Tax=Austwickia sp. TVS 96-490-7B TaxID=2830843 RepID=UPI001D80529E|nr:putative MFS-type transporter YfcJ [Austwickia sp. TVS 96-490-7B]
MTTSQPAASSAADTSGTAPAQTTQTQAKGSTAVVTMSTIAFTVMFAVWMMFGILAKPIRAELGINEEQYSWVLAAAILNGSMWRLPAGILTDRIGGRKLTIAFLFLTAIPCYFVAHANSYTALLALSFLVGFAGNLFTVGTAWNAAWFTRDAKDLLWASLAPGMSAPLAPNSLPLFSFQLPSRSICSALKAVGASSP